LAAIILEFSPKFSKLSKQIFNICQTLLAAFLQHLLHFITPCLPQHFQLCQISVNIHPQLIHIQR
jgi:hypothetical protein